MFLEVTEIVTENNHQVKKGLNDCGAILRRERELHSWSQEELVKRILALCAKDGEYPALTVKTIGRWEQGVNKPSPFYRRRLCQVFGKNPIQLRFIE